MSGVRELSGDRAAIDARLVDAVFAVGVGVAISVAIAADLDGTGRATPAAYLFAVGIGGLMLARRRAPRLAVAVTIAAIFAYYTFDFAAMGVALPAMASLYSAAEFGHSRFAAGAGLVLVVVSALAQIIDGLPPDYVISYEQLTNAALIVTAIALGGSVRARRQARDQQATLRIVTAAEHALAAERRVQEERMRIARDLHDVVAHTISVIAVHTHVAAEAIGRDDTTVRSAIDRIRDATASTMRELRTTVKVLRSPSAAVERGAVSLRDLGRLVEASRLAGLTVDVDVDVPDGTLDGAIDAAAYRIIQESLTNVLRHADATRARVTAKLDHDLLNLTVADDGHGTAGQGTASGGAGVAGMRERAVLLGGALTAGDSNHGFVVSAKLPVRLA